MPLLISVVILTCQAQDNSLSSQFNRLGHGLSFSEKWFGLHLYYQMGHRLEYILSREMTPSYSGPRKMIIIK